MRINPLFVLREIADEYIVVPIGEEAERIQGVLSLNHEGAFLWKLLQTEQTDESLLTTFTESFNVETSVAQNDISKFLLDLKKIGCLI